MNAREVAVTLEYTEREAREVVRCLRYFDINISATSEDHDRMNLIRSAIQFALPPPKPEEPQGLGAVVEDEGGVLWVRCENADREPHWYARNKMRAYADITAVRVLSEGVVA